MMNRVCFQEKHFEERFRFQRKTVVFLEFHVNGAWKCADLKMILGDNVSV